MLGESLGFCVFCFSPFLFFLLQDTPLIADSESILERAQRVLIIPVFPYHKGLLLYCLYLFASLLTIFTLGILMRKLTLQFLFISLQVMMKSPSQRTSLIPFALALEERSQSDEFVLQISEARVANQEVETLEVRSMFNHNFVVGTREKLFRKRMLKRDGT